MSVADTLSIACLLSVVGGAGNGVQWVAVMTALQEATPEPLQARVAGFLESLGAAMPGVGYIIGGAITSLTSPRVAYAIAGGGTLALVVIMGLLAPGVRRRLGSRRSNVEQPTTAVVVDALLATGSRAAEPDVARE
jgi:MFS family permease